MPVEVTWDQCTQLISPGGAFSGTADAGGFIEGGEQARLMETCIGEGQVAADTDIDDKKSRRTKNNGTGKVGWSWHDAVYPLRSKKTIK